MEENKKDLARYWISKLSGVEPEEINEIDGMVSFTLKTSNTALNVFEDPNQEDAEYCLIKTEIVEDEEAVYAETLLFKAQAMAERPGYAIEGLYERPVSSKEIATFTGTIILFENQKDRDSVYKTIHELYSMRTVDEFLMHLKYDLLALANSIPKMGESSRSKDLKKEFYGLVSECMRNSSFKKQG